MTDEIKRRLEAAGVQVKPMEWIATSRHDFASCDGEQIIAKFDELQFCLKIRGRHKQYYETVHEAKAAAEIQNCAAVLALLEVADD